MSQIFDFCWTPEVCWTSIGSGWLYHLCAQLNTRRAVLTTRLSTTGAYLHTRSSPRFRIVYKAPSTPWRNFKMQSKTLSMWTLYTIWTPNLLSSGRYPCTSQSHGHLSFLPLPIKSFSFEMWYWAVADSREDEWLHDSNIFWQSKQTRARCSHNPTHIHKYTIFSMLNSFSCRAKFLPS